MFNLDLERIAEILGIPKDTIDVSGKERQYGCSGFLLQTPYKSLSGGTKAIKVAYGEKSDVFKLL